MDDEQARNILDGLNRVKVSAPDDASYQRVEAFLRQNNVTIFVASSKRRFLGVGLMSPEVRQQVLDFGATITDDRQYDVDRASKEFAEAEVKHKDPVEGRRVKEVPGDEHAEVTALKGLFTIEVPVNQDAEAIARSHKMENRALHFLRHLVNLEAEKLDVSAAAIAYGNESHATHLLHRVFVIGHPAKWPHVAPDQTRGGLGDE